MISAFHSIIAQLSYYRLLYNKYAVVNNPNHQKTHIIIVYGLSFRFISIHSVVYIHTCVDKHIRPLIIYLLFMSEMVYWYVLSLSHLRRSYKVIYFYIFLTKENI